MTGRQVQIYEFIVRFIAENHYSPSYAEIAKAMGLNSLATVSVHLGKLERMGLLENLHGGSRSITPVIKDMPEERMTRVLLEEYRRALKEAAKLVEGEGEDRLAMRIRNLELEWAPGRQ